MRELQKRSSNRAGAASRSVVGDDDQPAVPTAALLIIVTFNSYDQLPDIAESVSLFVSAGAGNRAVVVENSHDPRVADYVAASCRSDRVIVETSASNDGFSHGVNRGFRLAMHKWGRFDVVALMNPDVISGGAVVAELVNRTPTEISAGVGVWGPVIVDEHGAIDRGCARRAWNLRRLYSHILGYSNLAKMLGTAPQTLTARELVVDQSEVAMLGGALMCITSKVFDEGLDIRLPMYLEDQEICMRARQMGFTVDVHADLVAVHIGGVSRKSVTKHERALRIMELAEAPVQCMHRLQGYRLFWLRLIVLIGGASRLIAVLPAAAIKIVQADIHVSKLQTWMLGQWRLAWWYISWAVSGQFHKVDISLEEYIGSFAKRVESRRRARSNSSGWVNTLVE